MAESFDLPEWLLDTERAEPLRLPHALAQLLELELQPSVTHAISALTDANVTSTPVKKSSSSSPQRLPRRTSVFPSPQHAVCKSRRQQPPDSRQRHNEMMRKNRHKFNAKFDQLAALLRSYEVCNSTYKPMKNKIQTLERAIFQYALMQSNNARFRSLLTFAPDAAPVLIGEYARTFAAMPSLSHACEQVVCHLCATRDWKYGEVWARDSSQQSCYKLTLKHALIPPNNMPDTRARLSRFAAVTKASAADPFLISQAVFPAPVWIPDLSKQRNSSSRARHAASAGITTTLIIPVFVNGGSNGVVGGMPDAIVTLMHTNDELLSFANLIRPYDSATITELLQLVSAVVKSRCTSSSS
eukprot:TRINITY_DN21130_c0_g1_i1.p1 TRINITY_DN21130_c0_g1~~TRINITY_DN21130_c0_g1_i1.p1  ORF type:complete len:356 (+),score=76.18 TRINITY_DN21130_c0_g1_i1:133-1200(+)